MVPDRGRVQARQHAQGRRLAGTVGAEQGDDLALVDFEGDAVQRGDRAVAHDRVVDAAASMCAPSRLVVADPR